MPAPYTQRSMYNYLFNQTYVMGTQKKPINKMVSLCTKNIDQNLCKTATQK